MKGVVTMGAVTHMEVGRQYRLVRPFEVRDEKTGTMRHYLQKDSLLKVRKVSVEEEHVWVDGIDMPLMLDALRQHVALVL